MSRDGLVLPPRSAGAARSVAAVVDAHVGSDTVEWLAERLPDAEASVLRMEDASRRLGGATGRGLVGCRLVLRSGLLFRDDSGALVQTMWVTTDERDPSVLSTDVVSPRFAHRLRITAASHGLSVVNSQRRADRRIAAQRMKVMRHGEG